MELDVKINEIEENLLVVESAPEELVQEDDRERFRKAERDVLYGFLGLNDIIQGADMTKVERLASWGLAKQLDPALLWRVVNVVFHIIETSDYEAISAGKNVIQELALMQATRACGIALQLDALADYNILNSGQRQKIFTRLKDTRDMPENVARCVGIFANMELIRLANIQRILFEYTKK
ncbi:MAG TPA: hypothetical protein PLL26_03520 [Candidatus Dojkabacteria bacterium]|nr:hypothetical protein [Candidatus Dojkabacteria bacterium]